MYKIQTRVWPGSTAEDGRLSLRAAVNMMQNCSQMWLGAEPTLRKYLDDNNATMVLASRQLDVVRLPQCGEFLEVITSIYGCNKLLGYRNTNIYDAEGKPCVTCWCIGAFVSRVDGKSIRLSQEVLDSLTYDPQLEMEYLKKKIRVPAEGAVEYPHIAVLRSDIDFNKHVNNAQYVRMACDLLPIERDYNRIRIEYRLPARYGDEIVPIVAQNRSDDGKAEKTFVALNNLEGKPYAVLEFSNPCS